MMRQAGMNFEVMRGNSPGHNLRCARSPVPPTSTSTCGNFGPTPGGIFANLFIPHADAPSRAADQAQPARRSNIGAREGVTPLFDGLTSDLAQGRTDPRPRPVVEPLSLAST